MIRALLTALLCSQLAGCFFVFIPPGVLNAAGDALTGASGDHCVSATAKVGDRIAIPGTGTGAIQSLSGASMRCTDARYPVRAKLVFVS